MHPDETLTRRKGMFYGWWIVVAGTFAQLLSGGIYFYGFSVFFTPLREEFGWSATALSGAFAVSRLESGIAGPLVGFLIDRFGTRKLIVSGFTLGGIGFILLSQVNTIEMFYVVFVLLISGGSSLGFWAPINAALANWFIKRRSIAFGIMTCGVGAGGFLVPVLAWSIQQYGWRPAAIVSGILFLATGIPVAWVTRHRPEQYGYLPDGETPVSDRAKAQEEAGTVVKGKVLARDGGSHELVSPETVGEVNFSPRQALATSTFWLVSLVFTVRQIVTTGVVIHEIPALQSMGYSSEFAALALAGMTVLSIPGRLIFGWLGDRWDKRYAMGLCLALQFFALLAFAYADDLFMLILFILLYAPAYGGSVPLMPATWGEYFGRRRFASISGLAQLITMWGTILGPLLAGYTFDVSGNYQFAFLFFSFINLPGLALLFFVKRPRLKPAYQPISG